MDINKNGNMSTENKIMEQMIGNEDNEEAPDEPHPKRPCFDKPSNGNKHSSEMQQIFNTMQSLDESLPIPQLGTVNIGQRGDITTNNYGLGNHQMHITHGGADGTRNVDLGLPKMCVQPYHDPTNLRNYRRFDNEVVSICCDNRSYIQNNTNLCQILNINENRKGMGVCAQRTTTL